MGERHICISPSFKFYLSKPVEFSQKTRSLLVNLLN